MEISGILKKFKVWIIIAVIIILGLSIYAKINGLRTEAVRWENQLSAQYVDNQNFLSAFISGFYEQLGLAKMKSDKLNLILTDAVKGRYEKSGGFSANGAFFAAIKEAYPDLSGLNIFDKIVNYVSAQREGYRATQSKLLDMLRSFDAWRQDGLIQSRIIKGLLDVPSERLVARIGTEAWYGMDAHKKMYAIVLAEQAKEAYQTSTMKPLEVK